MLRILLAGILLATPLLADHLIGSWNSYDPNEGDITLNLNEDGTFYLTAFPSQSSSDVIVDSALQFITSYSLAELTDSGMRQTVIQYVDMNGTFSETGDTIHLHHPKGATYNIDGHEFNTWEFFAFLAASILAAADLELSDGYKEHLIFLADTYMVDVILDKALLTTTLRYDLNEGFLTSLIVYGLMGKEKTIMHRLRTATAVEATTWGEVKSSLPFRKD